MLSTDLMHNDAVDASTSVIVPSGTHLLMPEEVNTIFRMDNPRIASYAKPSSNQRPGWQVYLDRPSNICYECYGLGHKKLNYPHLAREVSPALEKLSTT